MYNLILETFFSLKFGPDTLSLMRCVQVCSDEGSSCAVCVVNKPVDVKLDSSNVPLKR